MSKKKTQEILKSTPIAKETGGHIKDIKIGIASFERKETGEAGSVTEKIINGQEHLRMRKEDGDGSGLHQDWEGNSTETTRRWVASLGGRLHGPTQFHSCRAVVINYLLECERLRTVSEPQQVAPQQKWPGLPSC